MDTCDTCRNWEGAQDAAQAGAGAGSADMMLCQLISGGGAEGQGALAIGQDGEDADFLCGPTFGCSLWEATDTDGYSMDEGGDGGVEEIGGGAAQFAGGGAGAAQLGRGAGRAVSGSAWGP
jgi:hypothetical protein